MKNPRRSHWIEAYGVKDLAEHSWYQEAAFVSMDFVAGTGLAADDPIIDVGGGGSVFAAELLDAGFTDITVLDISPPALEASRLQLGARAAKIHWVEGDVLSAVPHRSYRLWHDRALLHFFVDSDEERAYGELMAESVPSGGWAILGVYGVDGPATCAGLPVRRHDERSLERVAVAFDVVEFVHHPHRTPWDAVQQMLFGLFRRR